jgi:hypothetical protein
VRPHGTVTLTVRLRDGADNPVADASVELSGPLWPLPDSPVRPIELPTVSRRTDREGVCVFEQVLEGEYLLWTDGSHSGPGGGDFFAHCETIHADASRTVTLELRRGKAIGGVVFVNGERVNIEAHEVALFDLATGRRRSCIPWYEGKFRFPGLPDGIYRLAIRARGAHTGSPGARSEVPGPGLTVSAGELNVQIDLTVNERGQAVRWARRPEVELPGSTDTDS